MAESKKKVTVKELEQDKASRLMNLIAKKAAYYRANPHRFCAEYLGITYLKWFQKILIWAAMKYEAFFFLACRGLGKTYLVALFCVCRCILYPGTKIVVSSYTFKQAKETVAKITDDFMHHSRMLCNEISKTSTSQNECGVWFKNGSYIICKVAAESSRGARANVLIVDESRMVSQKIMDEILIPMLNAPRAPGYLNKKQYKDRQEVGRILMMSSAYYKQTEMYGQLLDYFSQMLYDDSKFFVVDLPYQCSIESGLMMRETIEREKSKQTFNEISFSMEYEGKFYGSSEDALFDYKVLSSRRQLKNGFCNLEYYKDSNIPMPRKQINEKRILSLDIALLASRKHKNDASCFMLNQCICTTDENYMSNYVYIETQEGLTTEELGLLTMRYFYQYDCDYLAIDANGIGVGILDYIMASRYDPIYACEYNAMICLNNDDLNIRCKEKNANKCVYAIKANAKLNNDMVLSLRSAFQNGNINLLINESTIDDEFSKIVKNFNKLSDMQQVKIKAPYYQTTALIDEMINLEHDIVNNNVKVKEKSGMRKDRFSSIEYNNYVVDQLRIQKKRNRSSKSEIRKMFSIRPSKRS